RVTVHDRANELPRLAELQLDLAGIDTKAQTADFLVDHEGFLRLKAAGFFPEVIRTYGPGGVETGAPAAPQALADYLSPVEVNAKLSNWAATYPSLVKLVQIA